jgi:protein ImuA
MLAEVVKWGGKRAEIRAELQTEILRLQGFKPFGNPMVDLGLGPIKGAFPNGSFPLGAVHEFISTKTEELAASCGFLSGVMACLLQNKGTALWISANRTLFPPALKLFGVQPERCIFIDLQKERDVVWAMDEALKCGALSAVVGEVQDISFTASRRLQLAVEQSKVTGFILRKSPRTVNTTAFVSRWKITSLPGEIIDDLPGIGFATWKVELLRIRNGKPGVWDVKWMNGGFVPVSKESYKEEYKKKAG